MECDYKDPRVVQLLDSESWCMKLLPVLAGSSKTAAVVTLGTLPRVQPAHPATPAGKENERCPVNVQKLKHTPGHDHCHSGAYLKLVDQKARHSFGIFC